MLDVNDFSTAPSHMSLHTSCANSHAQGAFPSPKHMSPLAAFAQLANLLKSNSC